MKVGPPSNELRLEEIALVYRTNVDAFRGIAAAIVRDRDGGRDVVQEAFARALAWRQSFRREGSLEARIWKTVINTALSQRKRTIDQAATALVEGQSLIRRGWVAFEGRP